MLPANNVKYSSDDISNDDMNFSTGWYPDSSDTAPSVHLTFVEPVYLVEICSGGNTNFSLTYINSFGDNVTYMNVDGNSVRSIETS